MASLSENIFEASQETPLLKSKKPSFIWSVRFLLAVIIFIGVAIQFMQKIDMGIAIVCMVNYTAIKEPSVSSAARRNLWQPASDDDEVAQDDSADDYWYRSASLFADTHNRTDECLFAPTVSNTTDGPFAWEKNAQGLILSSYFYGYLITQIPSGWLSYKLGGKNVLAFSMLFGSIATMLSAPSARLGYGVLIFCRFLTGLAHGAVWPAISHLWINWAPSPEKSRLIGFGGSGANIGNVIALPIGGYLCANGFDGGWPSIFYTFGIVGVVWFGLMMACTSDSPRTHRFIGKIERNFILLHTGNAANDAINEREQRTFRSNSSSRSGDGGGGGGGSGNNTRGNATPWKKIFTSKACLALFFCHFCSNWGNYLFLTQLPTYMKEILQFDIKSNGLFSSLPYITSWLFAIMSSLISDKLIASHKLSRTTTRKLFNAIGLYIPMIAVFLLSFVTCAQPYLAVAMLAFGLGFGGCTYGAGFVVNINEIGGQYAGMVFGISNTFGTLPGIIAPYVVSVLTANQLQEEWRTVFWMSAGVFFLGATIFSVFASAEPEPWAERNAEDTENLIGLS